MKGLGFQAMALGALATLVVGCSSSSAPSGAGGPDAGAGCPATQPSGGGSCATSGLHCSYGCATTAICDNGMWSIVESNISCPVEAGTGACSSSADCSNGMECGPGGNPVGCGICAIPQNPCSADSDCSIIGDAAPTQPMVCGPGGECSCGVGGKTGSCIPACKSASDCSPDESCASSGHCVAKSCTADSECPAMGGQDYACNAGTCGPKSCKTTADCGAHYCVNGGCYDQAGACTFPPA